MARRRLWTAVLLAAVALTCAFASRSDAAGEQSSGLHAVSFQISEGVGDYFPTGIERDIVIWWDQSPATPAEAIRGYSLDTAEHFTVDLGGYSVKYGPRFGGDWVVWMTDMDPSSGGTDLAFIMRNLRTYELRVLPDWSDPWGYHTDGQYLVFAERRDVWLYEIATQTAAQVTTGMRSDSPVVDYPWVAWRDQEAECFYVRHLATTQSVTITLQGDANALDIDNGVAVWSENTSVPVKGRNILGMYLETTEPFTVTSGSHQHHYPRIDGDLVVWTDSTAEMALGRDIASGESFTISRAGDDGQSGGVSGEVILWKKDTGPDIHDWLIMGARLFQHATYLPLAMRDYYATPTPVPVCECYADLYNCSDFDTQADAQACYDYCLSQGAGDVHLLDLDRDGFACGTAP